MLSSEVFINFKEGKTISLVGVAAVLGQDIPEDEREWFLEAAWEEVVSASLESGMVSLSTSESSVLRMSPGIWRLLEVLCRPRFPWKLTIKIPDIFIIPGHQRHCIAFITFIDVKPESSLLTESESSISKFGMGDSLTSRELLDDLRVSSLVRQVEVGDLRLK